MSRSAARWASCGASSRWSWCLLFVAAALALLSQSLSWRQLANAGVVLSFGVVVPWARQAPGWTAINAIIADLVLMILIALPLSVDMVSGG